MRTSQTHITNVLDLEKRLLCLKIKKIRINISKFHRQVLAFQISNLYNKIHIDNPAISIISFTGSNYSTISMTKFLLFFLFFFSWFPSLATGEFVMYRNRNKSIEVMTNLSRKMFVF